MSILELLLGPSGAYLMMLLGFSGIVILVVSAACHKYKDILVAVAVCVGGGGLGIFTQQPLFVVVSAVGFFVMVALGIRRVIYGRGNALLLGMLFAASAALLFVFRAFMATFYEVG